MKQKLKKISFYIFFIAYYLFCKCVKLVLLPVIVVIAFVYVFFIKDFKRFRNEHFREYIELKQKITPRLQLIGFMFLVEKQMRTINKQFKKKK